MDFHILKLSVRRSELQKYLITYLHLNRFYETLDKINMLKKFLGEICFIIMVDDLYGKGFPSKILIFLTRRKLLENVSFTKKFLHSRKTLCLWSCSQPWILNNVLGCQ